MAERKCRDCSKMIHAGVRCVPCDKIHRLEYQREYRRKNAARLRELQREYNKQRRDLRAGLRGKKKQDEAPKRDSFHATSLQWMPTSRFVDTVDKILAGKFQYVRV